MPKHYQKKLLNIPCDVCGKKIDVNRDFMLYKERKQVFCFHNNLTCLTKLWIRSGINPSIESVSIPYEKMFRILFTDIINPEKVCVICGDEFDSNNEFYLARKDGILVPCCESYYCIDEFVQVIKKKKKDPFLEGILGVTAGNLDILENQVCEFCGTYYPDELGSCDSCGKIACYDCTSRNNSGKDLCKNCEEDDS